MGIKEEMAQERCITRGPTRGILLRNITGGPICPNADA